MPNDPTASALLVYGPLGIFVVLFAFGFVFSKSSMERERQLTDTALKNNEKLGDALDRLTEAIYRDSAGGSGS